MATTKPYMTYNVTYHRRDWSRPYEVYTAPEERESLHRDGTLDCGKWESIDSFTEGCQPGVYQFTDIATGESTWIITGYSGTDPTAP